jgi:hypothetical protein
MQVKTSAFAGDVKLYCYFGNEKPEMITCDFCREYVPKGASIDRGLVHNFCSLRCADRFLEREYHAKYYAERARRNP